MKHLLALAALVLSISAHAGCAPAPDGAVVTPTSAATPIIWESNSVGVAAVWYCGDGFFWTRSMYVLRWDSATPALLQAVTSVAQAGDKAAAITAVSAAYATTPLTDPKLVEVYGPALDRIKLAEPTTPTYAVTTNGTTTTRAAYTIAGTSLIIDPKKRAPVGEVCDCRTRLVQAKNAYCLVPSVAPDVAFCSVRK